MRAFLGIPLPADIRGRLYAETEVLRQRSPGVGWVEAANYHITVLFLKRIDNNEAVRIGGLLDTIPFPQGELARLGSIAQFPPKGCARVIIATLEEGEDLCRRIHGLIAAAFPEYREGRRYSPHITLGRVKKGRRIPRLEEIGLKAKGVFPLQRIVLFESILRPEGPVYRPIQGVEFPW